LLCESELETTASRVGVKHSHGDRGEPANEHEQETYLRTRNQLGATLVALATSALFVLPLKAQAPITFQYFYDDLNQLTKVVDSTGVVVTYIYDAVGNITQISRSSVAPGALTIFSFTPQDVAAGATVTIQGQGFSATASNDVVTVNGVAAQVVSATANTLVITVPQSATSGVIDVTVGGKTVASTANLTIVLLPVITSITPKSALAGGSASSSVTGFNLSGSTFSFNGPSYPPLVTVTSETIDPSGTSATLALTINSAATGRFTLIATNTAGYSDRTPRLGFIEGSSSFNTLTVPGSDPNADPDLDGLSNAQEIALGTDPLNGDTDGDGYSDDTEVVLGSDPLNPLSIPNISPSTNQQPSFTFSLLNGTNPGSKRPISDQPSFTFSMLNGTNPGSKKQASEQPSFTFSLLNGSNPGSTQHMAQQPSFTFSLLNGTNPGSRKQASQQPSFIFSLLNGSNPGSTQHIAQQPSSVFSLLNGANPGSANPVSLGPFAIFSILNGSAEGGIQASTQTLDNALNATNPSEGIDPNIGTTQHARPFFIFSILNVGRPVQPLQGRPEPDGNNQSAATNDSQPGKPK
jgi:YD repeat-containing protein